MTAEKKEVLPMKTHIERFRSVFENEGLSLLTEEHTIKQFRDEKRCNKFELYEESVLRGVFEGVRGLEIVDMEKFVIDIGEMSETEKRLFCMFGKGSFKYSVFGDNFHVSSGVTRNFGVKMVGELEKGTIQLEDFVPVEKLEEIKLKMLFEERVMLRVAAEHLLGKINAMHKKMNRSKKFEMLRERVREPMKKIFEERNIKTQKHT